MNWDGLHFLGNSQFGYPYDLNCAFLPLLPWILRICGPLPFFLVNNGIFVLSALLFYKLSMRIQQNARRAYYSTLLFIYNPASIHFSSFYTESLYFFLSTVMFLLSNQENDWLMIVPIAVATSLRSNSVLLVPFVLFPSILSHSTPRQRRTLFFWVKTGVIMALCVSPLILYLIVNAAAFCTPSSSWNPLIILFACNGTTIYSSVEEKYWNVRPFGYYSWNHVNLFAVYE
ncbi:hypothetical protein WA538_003662 [Blastocystis sp. DL]